MIRTFLKRLFSERCIIIHPVSLHQYYLFSRGIKGEIAMAEEAIGLAKSLGWNVEMGPKRLKEEELYPDAIDVDSQVDENSHGRKLTPVKTNWSTHTIEGEKLNEGDKVEVYGTGMKGYFANGMFYWDPTEEHTEDEDEFAGDEWKDAIVRNEIASTCLVRVRKPNSALYFGTGKVSEIGHYIAEKEVSAVFVNTTLTPLQIRNLDNKWNQIVKENDNEKKIMIVDRMSIILKIFAERAKTKIAKLQLELAWLKYIKSRLVRGESNTISGLLTAFHGKFGS